MNACEIAAYFRKNLRSIVGIHGAMFQKLLAENGEPPLQLAALFEEIGNRYLDLSEEISERYCNGRIHKLKSALKPKS